jgi:hypothetical protein
VVVAKDIVCSVLTVRVKSWKMDTKFHCTVCHVAQIRQKYTDDQFGFKESSLLDQNAPINQNTRVCNLHFEGKLCKDSVPIHMNLSSPKPETPIRRPLIRHEIHDENNITEPPYLCHVANSAVKFCIHLPRLDPDCENRAHNIFCHHHISSFPLYCKEKMYTKT